MMSEGLIRMLSRFLIGTVLIALGAFVINYHIPFSGIKKIRYDFRVPDGTISHVYPVARVRDMVRTDGRTYRPMIEDPVYLDVRTIMPYTKARIELVYQNKTAIPLKIGMKLNAGDSAFEIKALENEIQERGWTRGSVTFDLSRASYYNSKYIFAFSTPGLRTENTEAGEVRLSETTLMLERNPAKISDIASLWRKN